MTILRQQLAALTFAFAGIAAPLASADEHPHETRERGYMVGTG